MRRDLREEREVKKYGGTGNDQRGRSCLSVAIGRSVRGVGGIRCAPAHENAMSLDTTSTMRTRKAYRARYGQTQGVASPAIKLHGQFQSGRQVTSPGGGGKKTFQAKDDQLTTTGHSLSKNPLAARTLAYAPVIMKPKALGVAEAFSSWSAAPG